MVKRGGRTRLAVEPFHSSWIASHFLRQELECDTAAELDVFRFIDNPHAPTTQYSEHAIVRNLLSEQIGSRRCCDLRWVCGRVRSAERPFFYPFDRHQPAITAAG